MITCGEIDLLLDGYLNGDVDPAKALEIEEHIAECSRCSRMQENFLALRSMLRSEHFYRPLPHRARARIRSALRKEAHPQFTRFTAPRWRTPALAALATLAVLVLAIALWRIGVVPFSSSAGTNVIAEEVVDSHIRSLLAGHLTDVASTDQHTVKPWFAGKVDYSPEVVNLDQQGFILIGGRLDYIGHKVVSVVAYRRRQHIINLFSWPTADASSATRETMATRQGYHIRSWQHGGMTYWAVSDVAPTDLDAFVRLLQ